MYSELYTKYAKEYGLAVQDNIYNARFERPSLQALLGDLTDCNVLDLGCGPGIYAEYLLSQGVNSLTCLDRSEAMIEIVKSKFGEEVSAYVQDLSLGLPEEASNSMDVIISPLVLHYLEDLTLIFKEIHRVLKPNGYMVFSMHHPFDMLEEGVSGNYFERELITQHWKTIGEPVKIQFYRRSLSEITDAIVSSGLCITKISEGRVGEEVKEISEEVYNHLKSTPNFIFIKCRK